jgi:hypothetical protein
MCAKVPYESRRDARQDAQGMSRQHNQTMEAYYCYQCEKWHLRTEGKKKMKRDNNKYPFRYQPTMEAKRQKKRK